MGGGCQDQLARRHRKHVGMTHANPSVDGLLQRPAALPTFKEPPSTITSIDLTPLSDSSTCMGECQLSRTLRSLHVRGVCRGTVSRRAAMAKAACSASTDVLLDLAALTLDFLVLLSTPTRTFLLVIVPFTSMLQGWTGHMGVGNSAAAIGG